MFETMISESVKGYLRTSIELGAGDPILLQKKEKERKVIIAIAIGKKSTQMKKRELEFVTSDDSSMPEFYFPRTL
jgi:hypothetical protein